MKNRMYRSQEFFKMEKISDLVNSFNFPLFSCLEIEEDQKTMIRSKFIFCRCGDLNFCLNKKKQKILCVKLDPYEINKETFQEYVKKLINNIIKEITNIKCDPKIETQALFKHISFEGSLTNENKIFFNLTQKKDIMKMVKKYQIVDFIGYRAKELYYNNENDEIIKIKTDISSYGILDDDFLDHYCDSDSVELEKICKKFSIRRNDEST